MNFDRIRVAAYGTLEDLDTGSDPLPSLVVVQAPNEGGKTTFFSVLSSLLYGFYPASSERHPYAPWSGEFADAEARVRLSGDSTVTVQRRLRTSPWGRLSRGEDRVEELANRTVPWASHVRRELFEEVFALTLADLARVDEKRWPEIQDRLLAGLGAEDLRGAREVTAELDAEAKKLWRPDEMGKPRDAELRDRLQELNEARIEARDRDQKAREAARSLGEARRRLEEIRDRKREARAVVERATTLGPVRRRLARIEEESTRAGDPEELEGLPDDPGDRLDELKGREEELEDRIEEAESEEERLLSRTEAVDETDRVVLEHAGEIRTLAKLCGDVGELRGRLSALEERAEDRDRDARRLGRELFDRPWDEVDREAVREAPVAELRSTVADFRDAREAAVRVRERIRDREREEPPPPEGGWKGAGPALLGVGAILVLAGWAAEPGTVLLALGGVAAFTGALLVLRRRDATVSARRSRRRHQEILEELEAERERAEAAVDAARNRVAQAASPLPLAETRLDDPRPELVHQVERLQGRLEELRRARKEARDEGERLDDLRTRADRLVDACGIPAPEGLAGRVVALESALESAEEKRGDARSAREALERTRDALERARAEAGDAAETRRSLEERLARLGEGDVERGAEEARERLAALERARLLREELELDHPDLEELRRRIQEAEERGEEWLVDEEARIAAEDRVEELDGREKALIEEINDLKHRLQNLQKGPALADVESDREEVMEKRRMVWLRRDRLAFLSRVVRTADHRFRERNQPDLLKAAGEYLAEITAGRYRRLRMPEGDLDGTVLLQGPGYPGALPVDTPVSTGTREQVYLALRLAIVDHLDAGGERLPLFLDEAFVNWDAERRERGFSLLADLSGERQVFVFTCHDVMAESLEERGARLLRLDGPR